MKHKAFRLQRFKALEDEGEGVFEAIVAVFGNVDRYGDKIIPGAFTKSLEAWEKKGQPIPVIFSHNWNDLDAHIGKVLEAEERDVGLYVKGQLDIEEDFARKVWRKMSQGLLTDFSFAYDQVDATWIDGVLELRELEILEVGPTLVGANPATHLLGVKEVRLKPYPNEHACRLRSPSDFEAGSFRRIAREHEGKEYAVIMGRLDGEETLTEQAYRYSIDDWEAAQARSHCADDDGSFEAADSPKGLKRGSQHMSKEYEMLQSVHDLAVKLGAMCAGHEDDGTDGDGQEGDGKSITSRIQLPGDDGASGGNGNDEGQGGGGDVTPRTSRRSLLSARIVFAWLARALANQSDETEE